MASLLQKTDDKFYLWFAFALAQHLIFRVLLFHLKQLLPLGSRILYSSGFFIPQWLLPLSPFAWCILTFLISKYWVLQGSVLKIFSLYCLQSLYCRQFPILSTVMPNQTHGFKYHLSAKDSQIYISDLKPFLRYEICMVIAYSAFHLNF